MRKAQKKYCLINILEKTNKFFANNWFGEIIIKENKDKFKLLQIISLGR